MALSLDGEATTAASPPSAVTLSTSLTNDIICIFAVTNNDGVTPGVASISDTAGLTWHKRAAIQAINGSTTVELWWALSSGVLTNDAITVSWNSANGQRIYAFGVNGANTTTPFDVNGSLPGLASSTSAQSLSATISTANANTMLLAMVRSASALGTNTYPSGFSAFATSAGANQAMSDNIVSSTQSSLVVTDSWTGSAATCGMIVDAIQAASGATTNMFGLSSLDGLSTSGPKQFNRVA